MDNLFHNVYQKIHQKIVNFLTIKSRLHCNQKKLSISQLIHVLWAKIDCSFISQNARALE